MKTYGRCHERIEDGEGYDSVIPDSASAAAPTVYLHLYPCQRVPRQTAPEQIGLGR